MMALPSVTVTAVGGLKKPLGAPRRASDPPGPVGGPHRPGTAPLSRAGAKGLLSYLRISGENAIFPGLTIPSSASAPSLLEVALWLRAA